jgi:hypothetical protein
VSARALAGSRANKHRPIARRTLPSDRLVARREAKAQQYLAAADDHPQSCRCGMPALLRAVAALEHDPAQGSRPDHAARAVSVDQLWPAMAGGGPAYHPGTGVSTHATPLTYERRLTVYLHQRGGSQLTPRQRRRALRKAYREYGRDGAS